MKITMFVFLVLSLMLTFSCATSEQDGWENIMPGKNLEGWTVVDVPKDGPPPETPQWFIDEETGNLVCRGDKGRDWLRYDGKQYGDCVFHVEWRFKKVDGDPQYNSGVFVRNSAEYRIWHQAQLGSASGGYLFGNTLVNGEEKRISTRDQLEGKENPVNPAGQWNSYDITCSGSTISLVVNGVPTTVWENVEVEKGYLGLEAEGYYVEFRNVEVKEL